MYTYDKHVDMQRNALYAQYPGIEVVEVEDYTLDHHYKPGGNMDLYVGSWSLKQPDYLPIKTYVDYGMDKDPKKNSKLTHYKVYWKRWQPLVRGSIFGSRLWLEQQ